MSIAKASVLFVIAAILAHPYVDGAHEQLEVPRQNARSGERRPSIGSRPSSATPCRAAAEARRPTIFLHGTFGRSRFQSSGSRAAASPMMNTWRSPADRFSSLEAKTVKVTPSV